MTTLVAIRSIAFPEHYVRLDGQGVTSFADDGGGTVNAQTFIGTYETFTLERNNDGTVSFRSTVFDQVFIRLDGRNVPAGENLPDGGGTVNGQYTAHDWERFYIRNRDNVPGQYQGVVSIESAAFPGRFLRLDGNTGTVNVQGVSSDWEAFNILVVG